MREGAHASEGLRAKVQECGVKIATVSGRAREKARGWEGEVGIRGQASTREAGNEEGNEGMRN